MAQSSPPPLPLKVHEVFSVSPPPGTTAPTTLPLTFFDLIWLRLPPVERLFFYQFPTTTTTTTSFFFDSILPNLKHSLELTLHHFAPLAGNITWPTDSPTPVITYLPGIDSVPFTIAESTTTTTDPDFNFDLLSSNLCETSKRRHLVSPLKNMCDEKASLLALQVTVFLNSGFCVGITTHHAALDGKSSTLFMRSWAHICSQIGESPSPPSLPEDLAPSFERSAIGEWDPQGKITGAYVDSWLSFGGRESNRSLKVWETIIEAQNDAVKGTFVLTPSQIQGLKRRAQSEGKVNRASTFSVTCAYVLSCLVNVEQPESNKVAFIFSVDCRSKLNPPIAPNYFGNCIQGRLLVEEKKRLLGSNGFVNALEGIIGLLNGIEKNGVLDGAESWQTRVLSEMREGSRLFSNAGSPRFGVYGIDFGWGRPKKVDVTSVDRTGAFALSEGRDVDGGVEIGLALNKAHMETFKALFAQGLESF